MWLLICFVVWWRLGAQPKANGRFRAVCLICSRSHLFVLIAMLTFLIDSRCFDVLDCCDICTIAFAL